MSITIALSKGSGSQKYVNYGEWLRSGDREVTIIDLYESESLADELEKMDALVMTGGGDINPTLYGHPEYTEICRGIDDKRDEVETQALAYALEKKIPVLGICRGLQLINVHRGGTLIPHIPAVIGEGESHTGTPEGEDRYHDVEIEAGSLLFRIAGETHENVNSSHHQAIATLGKGLAVSASAPDGIIEGIEWQEPEQQSFLVAIQWHPERMKPGNPIARHLLERLFLEADSARIFKATTPPLPKEEPEEIELRGDEEGKEEEGGSPLFPIIQK